MKLFWRRVRALGRAEQVKGEIAEELAFHVDQRTAENIERGMVPAEARLEAERRFGRRDPIVDEGYDERGGGWVEWLVQDVRFGLRMLRRNPGFSCLALL